MRILANTKSLDVELQRLILECKRMRWAVAWASSFCPAYLLLKDHKGKITQLVVGTHFYQTHPDFIDEYWEHESVRFNLNPNGVFHPKVYLFEFTDGSWSCLVGSPNFTKGGFGANDEVAVRIDSSDSGADKAFRELDKTLNSFFKQCSPITPEQVEAYRAIWKLQKSKRESLGAHYGSTKNSGKPKKLPLDVPIFRINWQTYFNEVIKDSADSITNRTIILDKARQYFAQYSHFNQMPDDVRKKIAGFYEKKPPDWMYFGSMKPRGTYKQAINQNSGLISKALDAIPMDGAVTRADYKQYVDSFRRAFQKSGVATATRLLTLKRPDYFICLDGKNKAGLCTEFGITQQVGMDDYWDKIVAWIIDSVWWNSPEPDDKLEKSIWRGRAAFLDVRYYKPDNK